MGPSLCDSAEVTVDRIWQGSRGTNQKTNQQPGQNQQPKGQGQKDSSTKKGAWGRGTARTQTDAGVDKVRVVAIPESRTGVVDIAEPRAPT
jgi:hypothetical protein